MRIGGLPLLIILAFGADFNDQDPAIIVVSRARLSIATAFIVAITVRPVEQAARG